MVYVYIYIYMGCVWINEVYHGIVQKMLFHHYLENDERLYGDVGVSYFQTNPYISGIPDQQPLFSQKDIVDIICIISC